MTKQFTVLNIFTGHQGHEGITSVWKDYIQALRRNNELSKQVQIDVVAMEGMYDEDYPSTFKELGCKVHFLPNRKRHPIKYSLALYKIIKEEHYNIVHANGSSAIMFIEMFVAWLAGVKVRIAHSHNTMCDNNIIDKLLRPFFYLFCNTYFACGVDAGRFLFGKREYTIINNGKDFRLFSFDENKRKQMRQNLSLDETFVIGHVGSFNFQKNHEFLIKIYSEYVKLSPNSMLYLMGEGTLQNDIKNLVKSLGLTDKITFAGQVDNIYDYLQAMDVMVFPSRYEGLPNVLIEWQALGLPCVISDVITRDCALTPLVKFKSIQNPPIEWANDILTIKNCNRNRENDSFEAHKALRNAGFDIDMNAKQLVNIYQSYLQQLKKQ